MRTPEKAARADFLVLMVPQKKDAAIPDVRLEAMDEKLIRVGIKWGDGKTETLSLRLDWKQDDKAGPLM